MLSIQKSKTQLIEELQKLGIKIEWASEPQVNEDTLRKLLDIIKNDASPASNSKTNKPSSSSPLPLFQLEESFWSDLEYYAYLMTATWVLFLAYCPWVTLFIPSFYYHR